MNKKRNILELNDDELNPMCPFGKLMGQYISDGTRIGETLVRNDDGGYSTATLTFSMMISEGVYKLVVAIERSLEWVLKQVPEEFRQHR